MTLAALNDKDQTASADPTSVEQGRLGVSVRALTPQERSDTSLTHGLIVQQASGPAASAGIQPGDVILAINGQPITSPAQLRDAVKSAGDSIALLIQRDSAQIFVPVDLSS